MLSRITCRRSLLTWQENVIKLVSATPVSSFIPALQHFEEEPHKQRNPYSVIIYTYLLKMIGRSMLKAYARSCYSGQTFLRVLY